MTIKLALATLVDSRSDFYAKRRPLVEEELAALNWLRQVYDCVEAAPISSKQQAADFAGAAVQFGAQALIIHVPIWADPIFAVMLAKRLALPLLLLGNARPDTSSTVGLLGAGGALDQIGRQHVRVFDPQAPEARRQVHAFIRAAATVARLRGQTLGLFGGRSLGIFTTVADPAQWQRLFGVDIEVFDQLEIMQLAEAWPRDEVERQGRWLLSRLGGVQYGGLFTSAAFERQVRSYLATRELAKRYSIDFLGVKCQPELSDGYVTQCVAHLLSNGDLDADGSKDIVVHACESDADGALTMQILHLLSGGKPTALLDIRWFDSGHAQWTLANCGAVPAALCATVADPSGLANLHMEAHVFGQGGGGAIPGVISPQGVTLARLCRKQGEYWMAIVCGEVVAAWPADVARITPVFPKAFVKTSAGADFLQVYGSNHTHLVTGDVSEELLAFCRLLDIPYRIWR
jgi:L-fucose isomerase